jgi:hypothetical protein
MTKPPLAPDLLAAPQNKAAHFRIERVQATNETGSRYPSSDCSIAITITDLFFSVMGLALMTMLMVAGCRGGSTSADSGGSEFSSPLTISLAWDPPNDPTVKGYVIHYGTLSPNSSGSCNYQSAVFVHDSKGTVRNLQPRTRYYFTVSSSNGVTEGSCSSEVSIVTPPLSS